MKIYWKNLIAVLALHAGAVTAFFFPSRHRFWLALIVLTISLCPGIGVGWHRLLTHLGFKTPKWMEYLLTLCGYLALQGSAIWWVAVHRIHHKWTEVMGKDPHTPRDGRWWSHILWIICQDPALRNPMLFKAWAPDMMRDKFHVFFSKVPWLPVAVLGASVWYFSGFVDMLWAVAVPVSVGLHLTWLVNSVTHLWGTQPYDTGDDSRNNWWVALVTFGEGWHNNHHKFPRSARHGRRWFQWDPNWWFICFLWLFRLAKNVQR